MRLPSSNCLPPLPTAPSIAVLILSLLSVLISLGSSCADDIVFNRDIRPILAENCLYCHGQDGNKRQADLRLDLREGAIESGAIQPHNPADSEMMRRVHSDDPELVMPPRSSNRQLTAAQKELLSRWIAAGAEYDTHWAFVAPVRQPLPEVQQTAWVRNAIDAFVLAQLEAHDLQPSPEADRATLIKRLSIDLIGLPPTPAEVDAFVNDRDPRAYDHLVDRLLESKHYGERLALPWLDAARYADSNGFQQDGDTWQWIWRDWVVRALSDDLPFDQFTIWQLAGDLLPNATLDQQVASGFNRNHMLNGEGGAIAEEQRFVNLFDRMDTTATTWLGLTMACAQCHNHKYDPILQREYYQLMDAFNRVPEKGTPQRYSTRIRVAPPVLELPTEENNAQIRQWESEIAELEAASQPFADAAFTAWRAGVEADGNVQDIPELPAELAERLKKSAAERNNEERATIESQLRAYFDAKLREKLAGSWPPTEQLQRTQRQLADYRADQIPRVMVMSDTQPRQTHILDRGQYLSLLEPVAFATPAFLPPMPESAPRNRLGLAQWLVAPENPLTARVHVNRMWQHFFGAGIVKTAEDFGVQSEYPVHGALLDWLAVEFREQGWSMKQMHRLIVNSATYRQTSRVTDDLLARDADNRYYARASRFRMPAMLLRDWALAAAGLLNAKIGGVPVYPYQPEAVWEALAITKERDFTYPASEGTDLYRRSLYTFWRRTVGPANMFDTSNRQTCRVRTSITSTPLHALTTLNDPTWIEAARVLAERSMHASNDVDARLHFAFRHVLGRAPTDDDLLRLRKAEQRQLAIYSSAPDDAREVLAVGAAPRDSQLDTAQHAALTAVCLALLNCDEAQTRE